MAYDGWLDPWLPALKVHKVGSRFENAVATMLLKHVHFQQDAQSRNVVLHYIRTKDNSEADFAFSEENRLTHLIECKLSDTVPHRVLTRFAGHFSGPKPCRSSATYAMKNIAHRYASSMRQTGSTAWPHDGVF